MCGIAGWIDWEVDLTGQGAAAAAMAERVACRGPDAAGIWLAPRAALAHRRLIVVDPAGGGQPMVREHGGRSYVLTYNGELYNTAELRGELVARGHSFRGHSDTEVLLAAFMEWGEDCPRRLNGIFAFAVWNDADERLFLARDRLGVKPLFYARPGSGFIFGSELKALLAHPEIQPMLDATGLAEVFALGPARTPGCGVFRNLCELLPGHAMVVNRGGVRAYPYWRLESQPHTDDLETTTARVRALLADAAERQLVADVPVCTLLSGGLDSSALSAIAARAYRSTGRGPLMTWSIDYADNDRFFQADDFQPDADAPWVERVSSYLGTDHRSVLIDAIELAGALTPAMRARDLPGMADVDASLLLFCQAIKEQATVALSGECADEVFCGYPWFRRPDALAADTFPWSLRLGERVRILAPELVDYIRPEAYVAQRYQEALAEVPRLREEEPPAARMREIAFLTLTRWMPVLLDRKDRMSMATGLEVRVPFCDHRLVEYAWNIPWSMKSHGGQMKGILRRALAGMLPGDVLARRKSPYPKTHHPAYGAAVRAAVLSVLADPGSPLRPLVNIALVRKLADADQELDIPWFGQLMRLPQLFAYLVQVDAWLREYRVHVC